MVAISTRTTDAPQSIPVRHIGQADISAALAQGFADFRDMRGDIQVLALVYPLFSVAFAFCALGGLPLMLFFPMAAGLSLLGALVAAGFYELARRREDGLDAQWTHFFDPLLKPSTGALLGIAVLMLALFGGWVWAAGAIHDAFLGNVPPTTLGAFLDELFGTAAGWRMMIVGDLVGALFAVAALALSWVSLPMIVDRPVDGFTAIGASLRAVAANPGAALRWGVIVAVLLVLGAIPAFIGLAVVLPWLGYATWHLYTRIVDRSALPAAE